MRWGHTVGARVRESKHGIDLDRTFSDLGPGDAIARAAFLTRDLAQLACRSIGRGGFSSARTGHAPNIARTALATMSFSCHARTLRKHQAELGREAEGPSDEGVVIGDRPGSGLDARLTVDQGPRDMRQPFGVARVGVRVCLTVSVEGLIPYQRKRCVVRHLLRECGASPASRARPNRRSRVAVESGTDASVPTDPCE